MMNHESVMKNKYSENKNISPVHLAWYSADAENQIQARAAKCIKIIIQLNIRRIYIIAQSIMLSFKMLSSMA